MVSSWFKSKKRKAWETWRDNRLNWADTKFRGTGKPTEFFEYNPAWRLEATFVPDRQDIIVDTSKNRPRDEVLAGKLVFSTFELEAQEISQGLFVAYTDTSEHCYSGGKYLNLKKPGSGDKIIVDFNYAYSALCYYGNNYDCPLPSPANRLKFPIEAGQKAV